MDLGRPSISRSLPIIFGMGAGLALGTILSYLVLYHLGVSEPYLLLAVLFTTIAGLVGGLASRFDK